MAVGFGGRADPRGGDDAAEMPIFSAKTVPLDQLGIEAGGPQRMRSIAAANGSVLAAFQTGDVLRWYPMEDESSMIDFGRDRCGDISRVFLEPKGFHALITSNDGDSWYLNFQSNQTKPLPKLKGHVVEAVSWDPECTQTSTRDLLLGTIGGQILHVVIEGKERTVRPLFVFEIGSAGEQRRVPVSGVHRERTVTMVDNSERTIVFVASGCGVYAFVGSSVETVFQKYQGENAALRALVFEVPRDSPHGDLQVDFECVGPPSNKAKVLFWLTGVGVLAAKIRCPVGTDNVLLESPPGLIPFPRSPKALLSSRAGGSLVTSMLPPPPPPAPLSMALTRYHIVFLFEDRWAAVSRITHEVVQQQEWAKSTHGGLRCLARDVECERLWMCSERHIFEIVADREERNVWALLLRHEQFEDAAQACLSADQKDRVIAAHADWLFRTGRLTESARKFAESTVPFEHVALRFSGPSRKAALLEYLRCRFQACPSSEKVTRAVLGVWAVEMALAHLNDLQVAVLERHGASEQAAMEAARAKLHDLLRECRDLDVHATIYHLLQSHGWLEELTLFAEARRDFTTVILHHVSRGDYANAIEKLADFQGTSAGEGLVCRFAPALFGAEPPAFVSLLLRPQLGGISPLSVLPAVFAPRASTVHRAQAVRFLEHVLREHPEAFGLQQVDGDQAPAPGSGQGGGVNLRRGEGSTHAGSLVLGSDLISAMGEDSSASASGAHQGWASGAAVLNALVVLYACGLKGADHNLENVEAAAPPRDDEEEEALLRFLASQEGNTMLDPHFALRVCSERSLDRAVVLLYGIMGMHEEAVDVALERGDVALAKHNACKPACRRLRSKLWLRIVEDQAANGDVQTITGLLRESQELSVRDVLPYMSDSMTIDAFQTEICECLDAYEGQILTLRQEMDDHRRALKAFKEDLRQAEERCIVVAEDQVCEICGVPAMQERFYAFGCRHCFHEACLRALVLPVLSEAKRERLFALEATRLEHQASLAGAALGASPPATALAEVEDELDAVLADDCPLCGKLMIQTIRRPFIDVEEDGEITSWAVD